MRYTRVAGAVPEREPLDLSALARRASREVEGAEGRRFVVEEGLVAQADPTLTRLVLLNLLGNACKFSPEGGEVWGGRTETGAFFVRDQGVGFDVAHAETIFEPLKRLVRESEFAGSGMGLANVRRALGRQGRMGEALAIFEEGGEVYGGLGAMLEHLNPDIAAYSVQHLLRLAEAGMDTEETESAEQALATARMRIATMPHLQGHGQALDRLEDRSRREALRVRA